MPFGSGLFFLLSVNVFNVVLFPFYLFPLTFYVGTYVENELPQPQVVLACGFFTAKPDPWTLST